MQIRNIRGLTNLQPLVALCAIVDNSMNVSKAAEGLQMSQPAVSRQIKILEERLGTYVFHRSRKRLLSLTPAGHAALEVARRLCIEVDTLHNIRQHFSARDHGDFTIATTHTYARYKLPQTIRIFVERYPNVHLTLTQGNPTETARWVSSGQADLSIGAEPEELFSDLVLLPYAKLQRVVLTPRNHPLVKSPPRTLRDIARYPIITYSTRYLARTNVLRAFETSGVKINVVLSATDADVIKTYVRQGLGIAIVSTLAYSSVEDSDLRALPAKHLFEPNKIYIGLRRNSYPRSYLLHFINMLAPRLKPAYVDRALRGGHIQFRQREFV